MFRIVFNRVNLFVKKFPMFSHINVEVLKNLKQSIDIDSFFKLLIMNNRTSKQTEFDRFKDLDNWLIDFLKNISFDKFIIHDIGVSSGITSLQLLNRLKDCDFKYDFYISDKFDRLYICKHGLIKCVYDVEMNLLYIYFFKIFFSEKLSKKFILSHYGFKVLKLFCSIHKKKEILLFHPAIIKEIENNKLNLINFDILKNNELFNDMFNLVRVMNLLNLSYFSKKQIKVALSNINKTLQDDGVLIIGRTLQSGNNNATIFKKKGKRFIHVMDFNKGSEIADIVLEVDNVSN